MQPLGILPRVVTHGGEVSLLHIPAIYAVCVAFPHGMVF